MTMKTYTNLKILFPYIKKSKRYLIFGIMGILIASAIVAPVPYFIGNVLDVLVKENVTFSDIKNTLILISAIYFVKFLINMSYQQSFAKLQQKIVNEIRLDMVKSILDVAVFPQCYAAVVDKIPTMAKKTSSVCITIRS